PKTEKGPFGTTLTFTFDAADRRTKLEDSNGGVLTSVYDNADRLTSRQHGGSGQTANRLDFAYTDRNELGTITRYHDPAGTTVKGTSVYAYDDAGRVTAITHKNAANATLSYYNYNYDSADRVTTHTWNSGGTPGTQVYYYDKTDQLTGDGTNTWSYDANGN